MSAFGLLDGDDIRSLMVEVADELEDGRAAHTLIIVGGSLLAWQGLRDTTEDIDSIRRIDDELRRAARVVATRHQMAVDWLNDHAAAFAPATLDVDTCDVLLDLPRLRVLGAPLRDVFIMKLRRSDPGDLDDMRSIWPRISDQFTTARELIEAFDAAFPAEPNDDHLDTFLVAELAKGGYDLPLS